MGRLAASLLCIAAATVVGLVALTSNWTQRAALDTDTWVETSRELLADEAIRAEVAAQIAAQTPAGPEGQALITEALASPEIEPLWMAANEQTHAVLVAVLNESAAAGTLGTEGDGEQLDLDLTAIGEQLAAGLGLPPGSLSETIELQVVTANELETIRGADGLLDAVAIGSLIGALMLYALALVLAPTGRRRTAVLAASISLIVIGALTLVIRTASAEAAIDELDASAETRAAVEQAWLIGTSGLADLATLLIVLGSIGVAAATVLALLARARKRELAHP